MPVRRVGTLGRAALLAATGGLALAGCEKPAPAVGVFSGTAYEHAEATCWNFEDAPVEPQECDPARGEVGAVPVAPGQTVGISVDTSVAEVGWVPTINDQQLVTEPITTTYYRFALAPDALSGGDLLLRIQALTGEDGELATRGAWLFRLRPS